ncbi:cytokine-like protein 1 [Misgurnus anguillicaudatus]|uniref:cytokine-like protein 1 n=1 Tax=Misgurnus anguillicaudatus TaxID=75329 RepID=UPI002435A9BE|nr:CYTL1 domain-containing protein [Misgurnus anguillicaudatus]
MLAYTYTWLVLVLIPVAWAQPYPIPPTCYSKVLTMAKEITRRAEDIKRDPYTYRCTAHLPDLYIDVHNACVMSTMNSYLSELGNLRERRCTNRNVHTLDGLIRQLYIIISQKCHGDLVFTSNNCAALQRRRWTG